MSGQNQKEKQTQGQNLIFENFAISQLPEVSTDSLGVIKSSEEKLKTSDDLLDKLLSMMKQSVADINNTIQNQDKSINDLANKVEQLQSKEVVTPDTLKEAMNKQSQEQQAAINKKAQEQQAAMDKKLNDQQAAIDKKAQEQQAAMDKKAQEQQAAMDKKLNDQQAAMDKKAQEQQAAMDKKIQEQQKKIDDLTAQNKTLSDTAAKAIKDVADLQNQNKTFAQKIADLESFLQKVIAKFIDSIKKVDDKTGEIRNTQIGVVNHVGKLTAEVNNHSNKIDDISKVINNFAASKKITSDDLQKDVNGNADNHRTSSVKNDKLAAQKIK